MIEHESALFASARKQFPHTKRVVYFNAAAHGPFSLAVAKAIRTNIDSRLTVNGEDAHADFALADNLRANYAKLIGARKADIGLSQNTSLGINIAAYGLPLKPGDEILLSDIEFPASVYAWKGAAISRRLTLKFVPSHKRQFNIENLLKAITKKSRVLSISWVQFFNGYKNDLPMLSSICRKHNLYFVVDGIQGVGVEPIAIRNLGVDIFTSGCQKWLLSPPGCGFFYLSESVRDKLTAPFTSWLDVDWRMRFEDMFDYDKPFFDSARRYEFGFSAVMTMTGMKAAVDMILGIGVRNIQRHNHKLIDSIARYIQSNDFYRVTSSLKNNERSAIITFTCPKVEKLHKALSEKHIVTSQREGSIRVAVHLYNNSRDVQKLLSVLDSFVRTA